MNSTKKSYLARIRKESAYPALRLLISIIAGLLFALAGFVIVGCVAWIAAINDHDEGATKLRAGVACGGVLSSAVIFMVGKCFKEVSLVLADIADSITDMHSRYEQ